MCTIPAEVQLQIFPALDSVGKCISYFLPRIDATLWASYKCTHIIFFALAHEPQHIL